MHGPEIDHAVLLGGPRAAPARACWRVCATVGRPPRGAGADGCRAPCHSLHCNTSTVPRHHVITSSRHHVIVMAADTSEDHFAELAKLRAQLAQSRAANQRLDHDNRSLRASLRVARFEELEQEEQDVMLEHFLQVRFGQYEDEGEAGWELLRMLAQEPTWTPAVYDRSWAPSTVAEIRALAAETKGSRLATTLKKMCAMHRDYFLSAVLVPQPPPPPPSPPLDSEYEYEDDAYEYEPEHQTVDQPAEDMFEYVPDSEVEYIEDPPEYLLSVDEPLEYVVDSDGDEGGGAEGNKAATSAATSVIQPELSTSTLVGPTASPGVVARWEAVTTHVHSERVQKAEHFRAVVEAEMERVRLQREEQFSPAGTDAPTSKYRNTKGAALAAAEISAARESWTPEYTTSGETPPSASSESNSEGQRQRKEADMQAEVIFPYTPTRESSAQLEGVQLVIEEGDEISVTAILDDDWWEGYVTSNPTIVGRFPSCCVQVE